MSSDPTKVEKLHLAQPAQLGSMISAYYRRVRIEAR
jgi:hypothetical protein